MLFFAKSNLFCWNWATVLPLWNGRSVLPWMAMITTSISSSTTDVCVALLLLNSNRSPYTPADTGQMELYLRWLDRQERQKGEEKPLGLILCAGKKHETVEVLELEPRGIHVAEYLTALPPRELLQKRLPDALIRARLRLSEQPTDDIPGKAVTIR